MSYRGAPVEAAEVRGRAGVFDLSHLGRIRIRGDESLDLVESLCTADVIHQEDDLYVAECPEVGTVSQGKTIDESLANLREATELYLEEFPPGDITHPLVTTFEVLVNA